ncbi:hypothetical protein GQR58_019769 [Nymphon striatum]|nr:hypothetical protein GQR58_019769 [Nymphon striatum]
METLITSENCQKALSPGRKKAIRLLSQLKKNCRLFLKVVRANGVGGRVGGRLGIIGCKEFSPKVDGKLTAHVEGGASISWSNPSCFVQVLDTTIIFDLEEDYFVLSCRHTKDGPPDFIDPVTSNFYRAASMQLGVTYTFKLICIYQGEQLDCGTWSDVAYPDCMTDWKKNVEFCYRADPAALMTRQLAIEEYNKTHYHGQKATFKNIDPQTEFLNQIWPTPESPFLIMDKECFSTDCCHRYFKNDQSKPVFEKSCEANVIDSEHIILFVRYVPAIVANCTDIESAVNDQSKTIIAFNIQKSGWPTLMRAQIFDESSNTIFQEEVNKTNTKHEIPDLVLYAKYTFQCIPYMTDDWIFKDESELFINGSFMPDIEMNSCNQWNGKLSFIWNTASAKFIDADGNVINIPADKYKFMYNIYVDKKKILSENIPQTETSYTIENLHISSDVSSMVTCVFDENSIPCSSLNQKAEPPKVIRANNSHFMAYELKEESTIWSESETDCQACGGHLASIDSQENEKPLIELVSAKEQFHVGISSCEGSSGKWTDGKLFSYIPNKGHVYYRDKCCGSVNVDAGRLSLAWVNCDEEHKHACRTMIKRPQLKVDCKAETKTSIFCKWNKEGEFWKFSNYNISLQEFSHRETEPTLMENSDKTSHNFTNLKELTRYLFKVSTKSEGYPVVFKSEQMLYSGYLKPYEWIMDLSGTLTISWPEFFAHGDTSKIHNVSCKSVDDEKVISKTNSDPLAIVINGFLYGLNYTCNLKGKSRDGSSVIESSFNFTAVPSCEKDYIHIEDACIRTKSGNSSESSGTHSSVVDMSDKTKDILINKINETTIWISHSPGNCCYADINTLKNQICSLDQTTNNAAMTQAGDEPLIAMRITACALVILLVGLTLIIFIYSRVFYQDTICMMCSSIAIIGTFVSILLGTTEAHHITYVSVPFIFVLITAASLQKDYITDLNCWVDFNGPAFLPIIIPMGIIVVCSLFFTLLLLQSHDLDKDDMKLRDYERAKECMSTRWATVAVFLILTICWILGMFAENKHDKDCYIGFVVMSFLLGFSYIIIRCASETDVRNVIANMICCLPSNETYRWGSNVGKSKIRDLPENQSQVHLTKYQPSPIKSLVGSISSMRSFESNVSTISGMTTSTGQDSEYGDDSTSEGRPSTAGSTIAPLRKQSVNSMKFAPRFRPAIYRLFDKQATKFDGHSSSILNMEYPLIFTPSSSTGFADDLVISAASVPDAIEMSHRLVYLLNQIGLELNISKCKIFAINISGAPEVLSSELPITFLGHTDALKYLGSEILLEDRPSYRNIRDIISKRCESLIKYPYLHNWQKLIFCRTFITSLLTYPAQTDFNMQISTSPQITQAIRAINLLLESIFNLKGVHHCFIYGPKNGGLGFPNAKWVLDTNSAVTAGYIAQSADPQINHLTSANSVNLNGLLQQLASNLTNSIQPKPVDASEIEDKIINICTDDHKMKGKRITESLQGASYSAWSETRSGKIAGSKVFQISRHSSAFVRFPERFSNAELLAAIRLRGGVPKIHTTSYSNVIQINRAIAEVTLKSIDGEVDAVVVICLLIERELLEVVWATNRLREGSPEILISDNGVQLKCNEMTEFLQFHGITHNFSSLYYPQGNGLVERMNRTVKEGMQLELKTAFNKLTKYPKFNIEQNVEPGQFKVQGPHVQKNSQIISYADLSVEKLLKMKEEIELQLAKINKLKLATSKPDNPIHDVCSEEYLGNLIGHPYYVDGYRNVKCNNSKPLQEVISIVLLLTDVNKFNANNILNVLNGIKSTYPSLKIHLVVTKNVNDIVLKANNSNIFKLKIPSNIKEGIALKNVLKSVDTPYVLIARDLFTFHWYANLERQIRILSQTKNLAVVSGALRNSSAYWKHGCYQSETRMHVLQYTEGYYESSNECLHCDMVTGPFVAKKNIFDDVPLDKRLESEMLYKDWFLTLKSKGYKVMSCPDVMYFMDDYKYMSVLHDKKSWSPLATKWEFDYVKIDSKITHKFTCEEIKYKCNMMNTKNFILPTCCYDVMSHSLKFFAEFMQNHNISYQINTGSVLGATKLSDMMPWDLDGDLEMMNYDYEKVYDHNAEFIKAGLAPREWKISKCCDKEGHFSPNGYFKIGDPLYFEVFGHEIPLSTDVYLPKELLGQHTKMVVHGITVNSQPNPGLYVRNRYGKECYKHAQSWIIYGVKDSHVPYKSGQFTKCSRPNYHTCLDMHPGDGSILFKVT